jgi:hypothetical protein
MRIRTARKLKIASELDQYLRWSALLDDNLAVDRLAGYYRHSFCTPFVFADNPIGDSETITRKITSR